MQLFNQPFDAKTVKPQEAFEALPAGWYNARIINSEAKPTKDNASGYLQFELEILDGEFKGRKVFDRLNLWNQGQNAEKVCEIAHRHLSAYCHATGVFILQDSAQLHGIPLKIKLSQRPATTEYDASNDVKAVKHIQDAAGSTTAAPFAAPAQPAAPTGFTPPAGPAAPTPFGMNPALPPQPTAPVQPSGPSGPWGAPTSVPQAPFTPPAAMPAQPAPVASQPWNNQPASTPSAQPGFVPPSAPMQQPAPAAGPVPPWRQPR